MEILPLLRKHLKDDDILEILDGLDVPVIYDFDRSHENIPDKYWAKATDHGFTMRFDADQRLDTVFIYVQPNGEHQPVDPTLIEDVTMFSSASLVAAHATTHGIASRTGSRPAALPPPGNWIRLDHARHRVHYEFREGRLHLVTISAVAEPPST